MGAVFVRVARVLALANPLLDWCWDERPNGAEGFDAKAMEAVEPVDVPVPVWAKTHRVEDPHRVGMAHLGRIKHLMRSGWKDAIELDVGTPVLGYSGPSWPVVDGNHRLAAATLRGDLTILVDFAGQVDHAWRLLGPWTKAKAGFRQGLRQVRNGSRLST